MKKVRHTYHLDIILIQIFGTSLTKLSSCDLTSLSWLINQQGNTYFRYTSYTWVLLVPFKMMISIKCSCLIRHNFQANACLQESCGPRIRKYKKIIRSYNVMSHINFSLMTLSLMTTNFWFLVSYSILPGVKTFDVPIITRKY